MHRKVSTKQFNVPAGDTFQAISLAGGHVISINTYRMLASLHQAEHTVKTDKLIYLLQTYSYSLRNLAAVSSTVQKIQ